MRTGFTYLPLQNGKWCYLATFQDKFTRRIVGWQVSERMTTQLVTDAFNRARRCGLIKRGAIIHTDRGSQYACGEYRRLLYINGFRQSMSGKDNCYSKRRRLRVSFPVSRRNWSKAAFLNRLNRQNQKSSATSKAITIESGDIQVWAM